MTVTCGAMAIVNFSRRRHGAVFRRQGDGGRVCDAPTAEPGLVLGDCREREPEGGSRRTAAKLVLAPRFCGSRCPTATHAIEPFAQVPEIHYTGGCFYGFRELTTARGHALRVRVLEHWPLALSTLSVFPMGHPPSSREPQCSPAVYEYVPYGYFTALHRGMPRAIALGMRGCRCAMADRRCRASIHEECVYVMCNL